MLTEMRPSPFPVNAKPVMMKSLGFVINILAKESVSKTSTAPSFELMEQKLGILCITEKIRGTYITMRDCKPVTILTDRKRVYCIRSNGF
jgi:hypothetical protein